jgi:hypothetical protein
MTMSKFHDNCDLLVRRGESNAGAGVSPAKEITSHDLSHSKNKQMNKNNGSMTQQFVLYGLNWLLSTMVGPGNWLPKLLIIAARGKRIFAGYRAGRCFLAVCGRSGA